MCLLLALIPRNFAYCDNKCPTLSRNLPSEFARMRGRNSGFRWRRVGRIEQMPRRTCSRTGKHVAAATTARLHNAKRGARGTTSTSDRRDRRSGEDGDPRIDVGGTTEAFRAAVLRFAGYTFHDTRRARHDATRRSAAKINGKRGVGENRWPSEGAPWKDRTATRNRRSKTPGEESRRRGAVDLQNVASRIPRAASDHMVPGDVTP